jgi:hypothetical protein
MGRWWWWSILAYWAVVYYWSLWILKFNFLLTCHLNHHQCPSTICLPNHCPILLSVWRGTPSQHGVAVWINQLFTTLFPASLISSSCYLFIRKATPALERRTPPALRCTNNMELRTTYSSPSHLWFLCLTHQVLLLYFYKESHTCSWKKDSPCTQMYKWCRCFSVTI